MEFKEFQLGDLVKYNNDKISVFEVKKENYISTENMLPDKKGIGDNAKLPEKGKVNVYVHGDILISNIRPYFKKIWFADNIGSHSTDVLNLRITSKEVLPKYLYYYVFQDRFFEYMTTSSKGTKMPRGDKQAIMKYPVFIPDISIQFKIVSILSNLDDKIQDNLYIIDRLEQLSQTLFRRWFIDFEFPNEEGQPYKSSGGKMVQSELGEIPEGWEVGKLSEIYKNFDSIRKPLSKLERQKQVDNYRYYGAASLMDYVEDYIFDGIYLLMGEDGSVITKEGTPVLQYIFGKFWVNNHAHVMQGKDYFSTEYLYLLLSNTNVTNIVTGAVQPKINQKNLNNIRVILPVKKILEKFNQCINPQFENRRVLEEENKNLEKLRDTLLPKLLSGEIEIPDDLEV